MHAKHLLLISTAILLFSCGSGNYNIPENANYLNSATADSTTISTEISSSAAVDNNDSEHKFIRTADIRSKVKNVVSATYTIEDIVGQQGGFVTYTNLSSNIDNTTSVPVSADSTLETTYFTVSNQMTIRVPNNKLDTTLKEISSLVDFLDSRVIKADDVSLQFLQNDLLQKRSVKGINRLSNAIDTKGRKLIETTNANELVSNKEEDIDNAIVSNLSLTDKVKYSTITLSLYQRQSTKRELICNEKNIDAYKPGLGSQLLDSLKYGWKILESFFVIIVRFWGVFLVGGLVYAIYKIYNKKSRD